MDLQTLQKDALAAVTAAGDLRALDAVRVTYMGQNGQITGLLKELGGLPPEERKARGAAVNAVREAFGAALAAKKDTLETAEMDRQLATEAVDVTLPADHVGLAALGAGLGKIHPITAAMEEIAAALKTLGFTHAYGPEVETDDYNFTKLNLEATHPARQDQDTFYLRPDANGMRKVLRTQTSNVQIHTLEAVKPPFRVMGIGRVYRRDYDVTHTPQFHQVEGMLVDRNVSMGQMRGVLVAFLQTFFGRDLKTRMRPHYFPFTEPSAEIDMECLFCAQKGCRICKQSGWLEVLGCGMVHRNVLAVGGVDISQYQGFAFGAGVDRLAMLKYGIDDLRLFFESHAAFLRHFGRVAVSAS
jgi:phenylalanyl-tRNA synthetase alpha chain